MKHLSEALGIDFEREQPANVPAVTSDEDTSVNKFGDETNYGEIEDIIVKTHAHGMSLLESADTYELGKQPRIYEVAGQLLSTSLAAIKVKHAYEKNHKDFEAKKGQGGGGGETNNTQINNHFYGDRETLLKQMQQLHEEQMKKQQQVSSK